VASKASLKTEAGIHWRLWSRLPVVIRALLVGLAVTVAGIQAWRRHKGASRLGFALRTARSGARRALIQMRLNERRRCDA
jgi:hypothetical protein